MNLWMVLRISLSALLRNKLRTFLTALGIIIGVSTVITMLAIGTGAQRSVEATIASLGTNTIMIFPGSGQTSGARTGTGGASTLTVDDAKEIPKQCSTVTKVSPIIQVRAQIIFQDQNWSTQITGSDVDYPDIRNWNIVDGRFFTDDDVRAAAKVCVLGKVVSDNLFGGESPLGATVRIKGIPMRVVGQLAEKGDSAFGQSQDDIVMVPYTTCMKRLQRQQDTARARAAQPAASGHFGQRLPGCAGAERADHLQAARKRLHIAVSGLVVCNAVTCCICHGDRFLLKFIIRTLVLMSNKINAR